MRALEDPRPEIKKRAVNKLNYHTPRDFRKQVISNPVWARAYVTLGLYTDVRVDELDAP
jgi:hypothetical protein